MKATGCNALGPRLLVFVAAVWAAMIGPPRSKAQRFGELDSDTRAALEILRNLTPQGQAAALAGIEDSHREGELGLRQISLLAALAEEPAWTRSHRRRAAFFLAVLGEDAKPALDSIALGNDAAARQASRDAIQLHSLVRRSESTEVDERESAIEELIAFAQTHPDSAGAVIAALANVYLRQEEPRRDIRVAALQALARLGAAPALVGSFTHPDPFYYQHGKAALKSMSDQARSALLAGLNHRDPLVRHRVIYTLVEIGIDEDAARALDPLRSDRDERVRKAAAGALHSYHARGRK